MQVVAKVVQGASVFAFLGCLVSESIGGLDWKQTQIQSSMSPWWKWTMYTFSIFSQNSRKQAVIQILWFQWCFTIVHLIFAQIFKPSARSQRACPHFEEMLAALLPGKPFLQLQHGVGAAFVALVAAGQAGVCSGWTSNDFSEEKLLVHEHAVGYVRLRVCWTFLSRWQRVWSVLCAVNVVYLIVAPSLAALSDVGFMVPGNLWTVPTFGPCRHFKTWSTSTVWLLSAAIVGTECGHLQRHRQCWCPTTASSRPATLNGVFRDEPFPRVPNCDGQAGQNSPMVSWLPFQYGPAPSTVPGRGAHALWRAALGYETQRK